MALLGRARRDEALERLALLQLRLRAERLFDGREFWRVRGPEGDGTNRNWARGIAWQLLGMARTLAVLRDRADAAEIVPVFVRLADWVRGCQRPDGLWSVFVDEQDLTPDTGGSAGIAAALAIGAREGWLGADARRAAEHALDGLKVRLTPDGFLGGVSQSNKGGEGLQRGPYRSLFQMGMGLLAQLIAALGADGVPCH
jgi:rhamnogalacturonyl hydrolase YesR